MKNYSTNTHEFNLSELLVHILVRATAVVLLFGLAGCDAPALAQTRLHPAAQTVPAINEHTAPSVSQPMHIAKA